MKQRGARLRDVWLRGVRWVREGGGILEGKREVL